MQENTINIKEIKENNKLTQKEKEEIYINSIRRLIKESGIDKIILKEKLFPKENNEKKEKEKKPVINTNTNNNILSHIQLSNSLKEWYEKINIIPPELNSNNSNNNNTSELSLNEELNWSEDSNKISNTITEGENGVITFNGFNGNKNDNNSFSHYIFLKNDFSFDISLKNKIYSWKIKFLSTSDLIGVGLGYKNIVLKNNNKFLEVNNINFINGIFALIQTFNPLNKKHCIRPWNFLDKNLVNHVAEFPNFKKGKTIEIKYYTNKERMEFKMKKNVHIMGGIKLNNESDVNDNNKIMTPCIVFYQKGEQVVFSDFCCDEDNCITNNNED